MPVSTALAQSTCGCDDVKDIRNRICIAKAAISEYDRLNQRARSAERKQGRPVALTPEFKEGLIEPCVQEAVNAANTPGSRQATGITDNACNVTVTRADSACLRRAIEIHEGRHALACQWRKEKTAEGGLLAEFSSIFKDTREGQTVVGYMNEEKSGYQGEINFLRSELISLSFRCPRTQFEIERNGKREFTIEFCPPPSPRPSREQSECGAR
jgi:hypothetical protein